MLDGFKQNNLYKLNIQQIQLAEAKIAKSLEIWHQRLGHVHFRTLRKMYQEKVVDDLHTRKFPDENPFCEGSVYGKQRRKSFPKTETRRSIIPGEVFHAGLCGPMSTISIGGAKYFLLIKDDPLRYCYVYFF